MGKIYKCSACGQSANMELYDKACPNCGAGRDKMSLSKDFTKGPQALIQGVIEFVKNKKNRPILFVIALVLGFLLFQLCSKDESRYDNADRYRLQLEISSDSNGVKFLVTKLNGAKPETNTRKFFKKTITKIILNGEEITYSELEKNDFIYYPCKAGLLPFDIKSKQNLEYSQRIIDLEFEKPNNKAKCNPLDLYAKPLITDQGCDYLISWKGNKSELMVSWNGVNGNYSTDLTKSRSELGSTFDVWYYARGFEYEKRPFLENGTYIPPCKPGLTALEFKEAFDKLGRSPANSALTTEIKNMCSSNVVPNLDNQKEASLDGLIQAMYSQADEADAEGSKVIFECVASSIRIQNGKVVSFEVRSRKL
ncbi:MAG: hypothetical protein C0424_04140 [Sphingobacteriaceae bacterium]|nr:hypothetical protein [Sphingobacteriaceae bacterium]